MAPGNICSTGADLYHAHNPGRRYADIQIPPIEHLRPKVRHQIPSLGKPDGRIRQGLSPSLIIKVILFHSLGPRPEADVSMTGH